MMYVIKYKIKISVILLTLFLFSAFTMEKGDKEKDKNKIAKTNILAGDAYRIRINKLDMGLNNKGVLANVEIDGLDGGFFDGKEFLFSGGFFLTGYANGVLFGNAVASASRIEDYVPGTADGSPQSKFIYVLKSSDEPFGVSWQEWKDAVASGAYFYDGDNDGVYNPIDKNGNGIWDTDEDMPDLLGDETVWCVYNDGLPSADRLQGFRENIPLGIEVRQTIWGYATSGDLGNILFIRYSLVNRGTVAETLDSVFFGVWADPDIGGEAGYGDDLVGCDTTLNAGFTYNDGDDPVFGADPPAFLIDFFQGPWEYTDNPADTAYNVKGLTLGIDTIPGARNLPMSSFVQYMQGHPTQGDPDNTQQMRNYTIGRNQAGNLINPCNWEFGTVLNEDCSLINGRFMYSGDPVLLQGWLNTTPDDQRQMSNTGPFRLQKDRPVDVVVAYVVGRANSALNSVKEAKRIDRAAQFVYQNNFNYPAPPPAVLPVIATDDQSISLVLETSPYLNYNARGRGYNMIFEGFQVYMYNTNSTAELEGGRVNRRLIATYDVANEINNILVEDPVSLQRDLIYEKGVQLDSAMYSDPKTGRISLKITTDPFTNGPIIKGKPYFISITAFALNHDEIVKLDALGNFIIPGTAAIGQIANIPTILRDGVSDVGIVPGINAHMPFRTGVEVKHDAGPSDASVTYSVINRGAVTSNEYQVTFEKDASTSNYQLFYSVTDMTNGVVLADSLSNYNDDRVNYVFDGVTLNVEWVTPTLKDLQLHDGAENWFSSNTVQNEVGPFYMGSDFTEANGKPLIVSGRSSQLNTVEDMRRVELRFGSPGKAYRYVRGLTSRWVYPETGDGFVDVPFQAWVVDQKYGQEHQLAVGFTETANALDTLGNPDGVWNPGTDVTLSKEYIVIFNSPYDPQGGNVAYTGTGTGSAAARWAEIANGYNIDATQPGITPEIQALAKSPWFDALYVVGLNRLNNNQPFSPTGKLVIELDAYPLTTDDIYRYRVENELTSDEKKTQFDKVNVFPNPLFAYNSAASFTGQAFDDPYITFSNLPNEVTIKIYTLSGTLIRTLDKNDISPFLRWNLRNEDDLRIASGMYIAIVSNPEFGDKVLKFAIIMPQKQILNY